MADSADQAVSAFSDKEFKQQKEQRKEGQQEEQLQEEQQDHACPICLATPTSAARVSGCGHSFWCVFQLYPPPHPRHRLTLPHPALVCLQLYLH